MQVSHVPLHADRLLHMLHFVPFPNKIPDLIFPLLNEAGKGACTAACSTWGSVWRKKQHITFCTNKTAAGIALLNDYFLLLILHSAISGYWCCLYFPDLYLHCKTLLSQMEGAAASGYLQRNSSDCHESCPESAERKSGKGDTGPRNTEDLRGCCRGPCCVNSLTNSSSIA